MQKIDAFSTTIRCYFLLFIGLAISVTGCQTVGPGTAAGGAFGTFAGGLTGAAIGSKDGKTSEGALVGALTGGTLGAVAGNAVDRQVERENFEFQQGQAQQRLGAVSQSQILQMTQSGLSNDVIARQIQTQGIVRRPTTDDLINLKNQGVHDSVILAIQNASVAGAQLPPTYIHQPVEIVRQPVYVESYGFPPRRAYIPKRRHCGPRAGVSVRF